MRTAPNERNCPTLTGSVRVGQVVNMFTPCTRLPAEVWVLVFRFLSPADRLRARAVCTLWRKLVDTMGLGRDWTVDLRAARGAYKPHFWSTLRRWRVTSARLTAPRGWAHVAAELPVLRALIITGYRQERVDTLRCFTRLERVHLQQCALRVTLRGLLALLPPQLTHVRVCEVSGESRFFDEAGFHALSQFTRLQSFTFHGTCSIPPRCLLYRILLHLPHLQHLSLSVHAHLSAPPTLRNLPPLQQRALRSLELVDCSACSVSVDVLEMVPRVRSVALFFREDPGEDNAIAAWLRELPPASSLLLAHGPRVGALTGSIPSSVTRLALFPTRVSSSEVSALSTRLPHLRHLHLDPRAPLDTDTAMRIPRLFPGLRSLRLRTEGLQETACASGLQELSQDRVWTRTGPGQDRLWSCACAHYIPTELWTEPETRTEPGPNQD